MSGHPKKAPAVPTAPTFPYSSPPEPRTGARVTLRDIAKKLGVSHATICLGLRDNPRISKTRCIQIKETARLLGYRPDPMLTALSHYRRRSGSRPVCAALAWLSFWKNPEDMHAYSEFRDYWQGANDVAAAHGYHIEVFSPNSDYPLSRIQSVLIARNVSGILVPPMPAAPAGPVPLKDAFDWSQFPIVKFGYSISTLPAHMVASAQMFNGLLACRKMGERGYKRIGFVTRRSSLDSTQFAAGFMRGQLDLPPERQVPLLLLPDDESEYPGRLAEWTRLHRPDAVLSNLSQARKLLKAIGLRVPADIGLATLSTHDGQVDAGINQNPMEIGRAAAETIISLITHNARGLPAIQREILIDGSWVDGACLPDRRTAAAG